MEITIKSIFGREIFKYDSENNSMLKTLKAAIESGADLRYANLSGADLRDADLRYANLRDADLSGADLRYANLSGADLRDADLRDADLSGANLRYANLRDANLRDANLSGADLSGADLRDANLRDANLSGADLSGADLRDAKIPMYSKWLFSIENDMLNIGCKSKSFEEWESWFMGTEEYSTSRNSQDFKRLQAMFLAYKSYYEFMNK